MMFLSEGILKLRKMRTKLSQIFLNIIKKLNFLKIYLKTTIL